MSANCQLPHPICLAKRDHHSGSYLRHRLSLLAFPSCLMHDDSNVLSHFVVPVGATVSFIALLRVQIPILWQQVQALVPARAQRPSAYRKHVGYPSGHTDVGGVRAES